MARTQDKRQTSEHAAPGSVAAGVDPQGEKVKRQRNKKAGRALEDIAAQDIPYLLAHKALPRRGLLKNSAAGEKRHRAKFEAMSAALSRKKEQEPASREKSFWWSPQFAIEALRAIQAKCEAGEPLQPSERAYLAEAISRIFLELDRHKRAGRDTPLRADRALGLSAPSGKPNTLENDRNLRIFKRVEELRESYSEQGMEKSLDSIYDDVAREANNGKLDLPGLLGWHPPMSWHHPGFPGWHPPMSWRILESNIPAMGDEEHFNAENVRKIHKRLLKLYGPGK